MVAYLARRSTGCTVQGITDHFKRSTVTIGEGVKKVDSLFRKDNTFKKVVKSIEEEVIRERKRKYRISVA